MAERGISCSKFESWWQLWPPGTKKGKDKARKAYACRVKVMTVERLHEDPHELLSSGLREYLMSKAVNSGYIMHPATWLRGGHWQDDPDRAEKYQEKATVSRRVSRMDDTTRAEMARARRIREERANSRQCDDCGAEMFFGRVTNKWQCTTRRCYLRGSDHEPLNSPRD